MAMTDALFSAANDNFASCLHCGDRLPERSGRGRKRKYCDHDCLRASIRQEELGRPHICAHCNIEFTGRKRTFCAPECKILSRNARVVAARAALPKDKVATCTSCGVEFMAARDDAKCCSRKCSTALSQLARSANATARKMRVCQQCGAAFREGVLSAKQLESGHKQKYCSRPCSAASKRVYANAKEAKAAEVARAKERKPARALVTCIVCGELFAPKTANSKLCTDRCRAEDARIKAKKYAAANDNIDRKPRSCLECGGVFVPEYGSKFRVYCSVVCSRRSSKRASKQAREKRIKSTRRERVYVMRIFERDQWVCQMCGVDTPRSLRGTYEPTAPELDHIVPLARGGAHANDNVQCLCRKCNAEKSDTMPEMLAEAA